VQILVAVGLALVSAVSYACSAVLQQREAARHAAGGVALVGRLVRTPAWWAAMLATACGAALHLAALSRGSLLLVQPLGITALVFALVIGRSAGRRAWAGAGLAVVGLPAVLVAVGDGAPTATPLVGAGAAAVVVAAVVGAAALAARGLGRTRPGPAAVLYAVGAAVAFGFTSATAKLVWLGQAGIAAVGVAVVAALVGTVLAQHAYRDGGLGAPLATLTLVDPVTAGALGVLTLGEPLSTSAVRLGVGLVGVVSTVLGVALLVPRRGSGTVRSEPTSDLIEARSA
jgi:drug/metabolite transporter (DMT)-like permease